jgi:hypothetical protein
MAGKIFINYRRGDDPGWADASRTLNLCCIVPFYLWPARFAVALMRHRKWRQSTGGIG